MKFLTRNGRMRVAAFLGAASFVAPAIASPDLTVYGNLDLGLVKERGTAARLDRGYNNWLGIKGQENLGGGLSAIFDIQTRFNPDTGQQERPLTFWQGESTVGLRSKSAGTLRLGRALTPLWQNVWAYEPWANSGFNGSLATYQTGSYSSDGVNDAALGYANFSRIGNGVFYSTPEFSGMRVDLASEIERADGADARTAGAAFNYANGPLAAMLSCERNARKDDICFLGASYRLGAATVMGSYSRANLANDVRERNIVLAGTYAIGADSLRAGYGRSDGSGDIHKISVGYVHALSGRTDLYADLYREDWIESANGMAIGMSHTF
ncbi:porin [Noviherbaspirillum massiliense]|uniref:porin n=1 Tax=Noviherbaspirillum massiliense TaxID=1465823 RepID=UPI00031A02BB|nr:porin [Noviherbaspirillum massiliense]